MILSESQLEIKRNCIFLNEENYLSPKLFIQRVRTLFLPYCRTLDKLDKNKFFEKVKKVKEKAESKGYKILTTLETKHKTMIMTSYCKWTIPWGFNLQTLVLPALNVGKKYYAHYNKGEKERYGMSLGLGEFQKIIFKKLYGIDVFLNINEKGWKIPLLHMTDTQKEKGNLIYMSLVGVKKDNPKIIDRFEIYFDDDDFK